MALSSDPERAARQKANLAAGRAKRAENLAARKSAAAEPKTKRPVVRAGGPSNPKPKAKPSREPAPRDDDRRDGSTGGFLRGLFDW
jgi:hypothetical protein